MKLIKKKRTNAEEKEIEKVVEDKPCYYKSVKWYINNTCNLHCPFCFVQNIKEENNSIDNKFKILDKLHSEEVNHIDFFGKEPLLNEDIFKIMSYGKSKNYDFYYTFISNGKNLKKYTQQILDSPCRNFTISYDFHKGQREYQFNLEDLLPFKGKFQIELTIDLYKENLSEVIENTEQVLKYGVTSLYFNPIMPIKGSDLVPLSPQEYYDFMDDFINLISNKGLDIGFTFKIPFQMKKLSQALKDFHFCDTDLECEAGKDYFFCISCSGIAYGCCTHCASGNRDNSCDYLNTSKEEVYKILSDHNNRRMCL